MKKIIIIFVLSSLQSPQNFHEIFEFQTCSSSSSFRGNLNLIYHLPNLVPKD